jgi:hypothetical protein
MLIEVTVEDIEEGKREDCNNCPVARAISRTLNRPSREIAVDGVFIEVAGDSFHTPFLVIDFIRAFDDGEPVYPISFTLGDGS